MTVITDLRRIISTNLDNQNQELRDFAKRLGVYPELLYNNEGRVWYPITKKMARICMKLSLTGEVVIFPPKKIRSWLIYGRMPKLVYDAKGRVKHQVI